MDQTINAPMPAPQVHPVLIGAVACAGSAAALYGMIIAVFALQRF